MKNKTKKRKIQMQYETKRSMYINKSIKHNINHIDQNHRFLIKNNKQLANMYLLTL